MASSDEKHDLGLSLGYVIFVVLVLVLLVTESGRGLDPRYVSLFTGLLIAGIVGMLVLIAANKFLDIDDDEFTLTPVSSSQARGLAHLPWWVSLIGMIFLILVFTAGSIGTQQSIIPIINPYDSTNLLTSADLDSFSSTFWTAGRSGLYAGVAEDTIGWVFVTILTLGQLWVFRRFIDDAGSIVILVILCGIIACAAWALLFATAHLLAYGINMQAYAGAATYGFLSQFVNFLVGAPVSVVAHFSHNFLLILGVGIALSFWGKEAVNATTTGASIAGAFLMQPLAGSRARRGNIALISIIAVVIIAAIAAAIYFAPNKPLDIGEQAACQDWTATPEAVSCASDADCTSHFVPAGQTLDADTGLRCAAGSCQYRVGSCIGSVTP